MPLADYAKNKDNFEFVKEFNKLNSYSPSLCLQNSKTGDVFQINKGFVFNMLDQDDTITAD